MTTKAQIKKLVKPWIELHPELAYVEHGRLLIVMPVQHVLAYILMDGSSDKTRFRPTWAVFPSFIGLQEFGLGLGERLRGDTCCIGKWADPEMQGKLLAKIEQETLPILNGLGTIEAVEAHMAAHNMFGYEMRPYLKMTMEIACGRLEAARTTQLHVVEKMARVAEPGAYLKQIHSLCNLLDNDDRPGMARLLYEREIETIRNLKIEHLWEPTPFPLELI
jgi:hypothetical protein